MWKLSPEEKHLTVQNVTRPSPRLKIRIILQKQMLVFLSKLNFDEWARGAEQVLNILREKSEYGRLIELLFGDLPEYETDSFEGIQSWPNPRDTGPKPVQSDG